MAAADSRSPKGDSLMIEARSVCMQYGKAVALDAVSFTAERGKVLGLLGPNGAGKTTLMRILTTYLYPTKGTALVEGRDVTAEPLAVRSLIGYMPESVPLYDDMVVDEYLVFIGRARGLAGDRLDERIRWVRRECGLDPIWKHTIAEISKGFRQRVGLAQALIHDPGVLILDEPTAGLDPLQIIAIRGLVRRLAEQKTILFSTHILQEVEALADRIVILNNGRVIADGTHGDITGMATKGERLTLVVKASEREVRNALQSEEMVKEARFAGSEGSSCVKFLLNAEAGAPLQARISAIVEEKGWALKELRREQATFEEAFIWLLTRDLKKRGNSR